MKPLYESRNRRRFVNRGISVRKRKKNTSRAACSRNPLTRDFFFRIYRNENSPSYDSHPRLSSRDSPSSRSLRAGAFIYAVASTVHEASRTKVFPEESFFAMAQELSTSEIDYGGGRTRILIFALAMFRVRPGVNWMLIAVDSWPYIRGTLSPSPPGGPSGPGPQVVYPHVTPLCSATTTTVPPSRATTTPLWDRRPTLPHPYGYASRKETAPLLLQRTGLVLFLLRPSARAMPDFFFFHLSSHIFADTMAAL